MRGEINRSGLELMADREPCAGACNVCLLLEPLTPERLARLGAEAAADLATAQGRHTVGRRQL